MTLNAIEFGRKPREENINGWCPRFSEKTRLDSCEEEEDEEGTGAII